MTTTRATALHPSPRDHLEKLQRLADRMHDTGMHRDDFDDFCKTAWHLIEQVEKDPAASAPEKRGATRLRRQQNFVVCEYLANTSKHGHARPATLIRSGFSVVEITVGFGTGRFGMGPFGIGEQTIVAELTDGTKTNALEIVRDVMAQWNAVLA